MDFCDFGYVLLTGTKNFRKDGVENSWRSTWKGASRDCEGDVKLLGIYGKTYNNLRHIVVQLDSVLCICKRGVAWLTTYAADFQVDKSRTSQRAGGGMSGPVPKLLIG